jgi:hypothetical protein
VPLPHALDGLADPPERLSDRGTGMPFRVANTTTPPAPAPEHAVAVSPADAPPLQNESLLYTSPYVKAAGKGNHSPGVLPHEAAQQLMTCVTPSALSCASRKLDRTICLTPRIHLEGSDFAGSLPGGESRVPGQHPLSHVTLVTVQPRSRQRSKPISRVMSHTCGHSRWGIVSRSTGRPSRATCAAPSMIAWSSGLTAAPPPAPRCGGPARRGG